MHKSRIHCGSSVHAIHSQDTVLWELSWSLCLHHNLWGEHIATSAKMYSTLDYSVQCLMGVTTLGIKKMNLVHVINLSYRWQLPATGISTT